MAQHDDKVNIFGHPFTWQELSTITLLLAALIAAIAGIIGNNTILYLSSSLFLLSTFISYTFFFMRQTEINLNKLSNSVGTVNILEQKLDTLIKSLSTINTFEEKLDLLVKVLDAAGKIELLVNPNDIFHHGILAIEKSKTLGGWEKVRIYAPVGLWDPSPAKDQWLEKLQEALGDLAQGNKTADVKAFRAVYGLPSSQQSYYDYAKRRLKLFKSTNDTQIHYLPPEDGEHPTQAPGVGAIIFENRSDHRYEVIFAFVCKVTEKVFLRSGYILKHKEIGPLLADWFDEEVFDGTSQNYVFEISTIDGVE